MTRRTTHLTRRTFTRLAAASATAGLFAPAIASAQGKARIVVVGGGFGGATAARFAATRYSDVDVALIEPYDKFVTCPYGNVLLSGRRVLGEITHSYDGVAKAGVKLVRDWADGIDTEKKTIRLRTGSTVAYDKLILSPGIAIRWGALAGYDEAAAGQIPHAWMGGDGSQITTLRRQLEAMPDGGVVAMSIPANPFRCPPGPYERISMIASYLKQAKPKSKILALDAKDAFSKQNLFLDGWKELYGDMVEWVPLAKDGKVVRVDVAAKTFETEFGAKHKFDVGTVVPPQSAAKIAADAGLTNETGWVPVNPRTFEATKAAHVYVIGDANIGQPMPKSGYIANSTAKQAVAAAVASLKGEPPPQSPVYYNTCYSHIGADYGISIVGVFRPTDQGFAETPNSGGVSPRGPLADQANQRKLEAQYADAWYASIVKDAFG